MSHCPDCGEEVSNDAAFCEACGTSLEATSQGGEPPTEDISEEPTAATEEEQSTIDGIRWRHAGAAVLIALLPAFGAYMLYSLAANSATILIFFLALPVLAYLLYKRPTVKAMLGGMCFWLALEAFLSPVVMLLYTVVFASQETSTAAGEAGAAIGGTILIIVAFVVGIPLGIVLYLASGRLEPDEPASAITG